MNWLETEEELNEINKQIVILHNLGEKNWSKAEHELVEVLRKRCVQLQDIRYELLRKNK